MVVDDLNSISSLNYAVAALTDTTKEFLETYLWFLLIPFGVVLCFILVYFILRVGKNGL